MSHLSHLSAPEGVPAGQGYSRVVPGGGRLVAVPGRLAVDERDGIVGPDHLRAQARQVLADRGPDRCPAAAGAGAGAGSDGVVTSAFPVTGTAFLPSLREAREADVDTVRPPGGTAVRAAALIRPEPPVGGEAFAIVPAAPTTAAAGS